MKRILVLLLILLLMASVALTAGAETDIRSRLFTLLSENYNQSVYTIASYAVYHAALTEALQIYDSPTATEEELSAAVAKLSQGISQLVPVLDKSALSEYVDILNSKITDVRLEFSEELEIDMIALRNELLALSEDKTATAEALTAAIQKYDALRERMRNEITEVPYFSVYNENDGVIVPEDYMESEETAGLVTQLRVYMVYVAVVAIPVGLTFLIIYLVTGRNQNDNLPKN